ncbi:MAG: hypothetical protein ACTSWV_02550 [Candidatus Asgardarchaeia archaeon]
MSNSVKNFIVRKVELLIIGGHPAFNRSSECLERFEPSMSYSMK